MLATIVFDQLWKALHEREPDGSRRWRYIVLEGSSRSSKTASIIQAMDLMAQESNDWRICAYRNTKKDCRDTVLKDIKKYFAIWEWRPRKYNATESFYTYKTRSTLEIHGCDQEVSSMGANKQVAWLNEPYLIARDVFDQIDQRTSEVIIIDWNPKEEHWVDKIKKDPRCLTLHSTYKMNPLCPLEEKRKVESYQPLTRCEIVESGLLTAREAVEYDVIGNPLQFTKKQIKELYRCLENENKESANDFFWSVYGLGEKAERPHRIFKWKEIPDAQYHDLEKPVYYGLDFGEIDPCALLEGKYYDGALYLHELNYRSENSIRETLSVIEKVQIGEVPEGMIVWLMNRLGIKRNLELICDDSRRDKMRALRIAGFNVHPAQRGPGSILDGISLLNNMPVYYTASSRNIKREQETYSWKVDRYGIVVEEPEDFNNHTMDTARYIAQRLRFLGHIKLV